MGLTWALILLVGPVQAQQHASVSASVSAFGPDAQGVLRFVIDAEPAHLNPLLDPDLWGYRIAHDLLCEPLVRRRPQKEDQEEQEERGGTKTGTSAAGARFEPVLAERFRLDADGRGIELFLRSGVHFHDGRPLTAFDVRATLEMVRSAAGAAPHTQALLADVVRVQVIGKEQLRIDLRHASRGGAILAALSEIDILPASYFQNGRLIHQPFNRHPVCTGPYRLVEWHRNNYLLLRRYPGYWGAAAPVEELRFRVAVDGAQGLSLLRQGEADVLGRVMPRYLADQVEPAVKRGRFRKIEIDANQVVVMLPNGRHPLLGLPAVRRALALLLDQDHDRDRLVRDVRKGLGTPMPFFLPGRSSALGTSAAGPLEGSQPPGQAAAENPEALLDQVGVLRMAPDGPRRYDGQPLRLHLLMPAGASELQDVERRLAESLSKLGIKLESEPVDLATFHLRLRRSAFELALCAWSWTGTDRDFDIEPLLGYALPPGTPLLAELSAAFATLRDGDESPQQAARLLSRWQAESPIFLLYRPRQVVLLGPQVLPAHPLLAGDFLNLRWLAKQPPRLLESGLR